MSSYLESFRKERGYMMESDRLSVRKSTMEDHIRFDFSFLKIRNAICFSLVCYTDKN